MKSRLLLMVLLLFTSFAFSQAFDVKGTVLDGSGLSLPGVNVKVKSSSQSTTTDFDGSFKLLGIPKGTTIVLSYIGFRTQEIVVSSSIITVKMSDDARSLDEVVVLGYSSKKKRDVTGAVSIVSSKTIEDLHPIKVEQALQGTVAGVSVTAQSGSPGAAMDIHIRGVATNGNNAATVFIDGYQGDLSILNPSDIESITVLKDAQAAIYGVLGANGIVLVTTKTGKKNSKTKVSFNSSFGTQETTKKMSVLNATEYALLLNESYANGGQTLPYPNVSGLGKGTDWQDEIFNPAPIINNDISISGGSDKITYTFSGSDLSQQGIIGGSKSDFKRNTARLSLGVDLSSKIKLQTNIIYTYLDRDSLNENGLGSVLFNAINTPSTLPVRDQNGNYTLVPSTPGYGVEIINPLAQIENTYNDYKLKKLNGSVSLTYDVTKEFKLTSRIGFNTGNSIRKNFSKQISYGGKVFDISRSSVTQNTVNDNDYTYDFLAEYKKTLFDSHNIKAIFVSTSYKTWGSGLGATGYDVPNNSWQYADINLAKGTSPAGGRDVSSYNYDERRISYVGILEYDFKGKYLFSGVIRRDASTKFGPDNRVAFFPSFTGGWVVSEESFLKDNSFINFLKLRVSYGVLGNDLIPNNGYAGLLDGEATYVYNGALVNGTAIGALPNSKLQWEEAKKFDVGLDFRLFNEKIDFTADYFIDTRDNLLIPRIPVSAITGVYAPGASPPTMNAGSVRNKGFEFAINYKDKISDSFNFNIGYNITTINNEVLEVANSTGYTDAGSFGVGQPLPPSRMEKGQPIGYFYGYKTDGIFQNQAEIAAHPSQAALGSVTTAPGDIRYIDLNNDGVIDSRDRTNIGDPIASVIMGLNLTFNYKNLDFLAYSYASIGNDMVRNYERTLTDVNKSNYVLGRWTGEGTSNTVPRVTTGATNNTLFSDYYVEDASFLRIQNVQLGYTLNKAFSDKIGISKLRLYMGVNNLYTFTKYRGFDPAALSGPLNADNVSQSSVGSGIDNGFYPTPRIYTMGLNLNF
ncbi:membrane protein [Flavobacterium sp. KMS]|uniref:SusC/RagA family TonB-linked outer membrane protein n=1 Tax=Flavobacterium sp. KMS TaxID=1566023 RepID=UPI00057E71A6|nr:TonB-dependent receptor [Flavobacterium sp. KMS]KIA98819.1 membrane protein [Flavobacterium sp. KMS]